jgi:hypothetical protein
MSQLHKVTVNEPFELTPNQFEVIKELAEIEGESLGEWIYWCVIKSAEMHIEASASGGNIGQAINERLKEKWGPESPYWGDEEELNI